MIEQAYPLTTSDLDELRFSVTPAVSIIMPCYNARSHLPSSVASVLAQTLTGWELIAVDDGSQDGTLRWLQAQCDPRLHVISQPNHGVSAARNAGLRLSRGTFIAFLDADDTWAPTFLERMILALRSNSSAVLAYCGWQNLGVSGGRGQPFVPPDYETPIKREILFAGCRWPIHAAMGRREAVLAAGGFNPALKNAEDYALWLEMAGTSTIVRVPEVLAFYHFHGGEQASASRARAALQLLQAQSEYLTRHPDFNALLAPSRRRELMYGNLLRAGFDSYWKRDLPAAREIFRRVMRAGYGSPSDWVYMLPALLPLSLHQALLRLKGRKPCKRTNDSSHTS